MKQIIILLFISCSVLAQSELTPPEPTVGYKVHVSGTLLISFDDNILIGEGNSDPYSDEYQTVYNSFTNKPSDAIAEKQNTLVEALVDAGVWAKRDIIYFFAQETNDDGEALKNLKSPGTFDAILVDAPTFTSLEGFAGNGTSSYIRTNWDASTNAVTYTLNDASISGYFRTGINDGGSTDGFKNGASKGAGIASRVTTNLYSKINDGSSLGYSTSDFTGLLHISRTASDARAVYRNNTLKASDANASDYLVAIENYVLARNSNGTADRFATCQVSYYSVGGSLTETERQAEMDAVESYMDSNSKGVID